MKHWRIICRVWVAITLMASLAAARLAGANQFYGDFSGVTIKYLGVNEVDSQIIGPPIVNSTPLQLFGPPTPPPPLSNDLSFDQMSFSVLVANGQFELQDGKLTMDIIPTVPELIIHSFLFAEGGGWRVFGPNGSALAEATLLFNDFRITETNGIPLVTPIIVNPSFTVSSVVQSGIANVFPSTGDITFTSAGGNGVGTWNIAAFFDIDAALAAANRSGELVTRIKVALDDQLLGVTQEEEGLSLAAIDKKHFIISTNANFIPEPSTLVLGILAGLGLAFVARRRCLPTSLIAK